MTTGTVHLLTVFSIVSTLMTGSFQMSPMTSIIPHMCVRLCACSLDHHTRLYSANCSNRDLSRIPENISNDFHQVDLSYNRIREVPAQMFIRLQSLDTLDLSHNVITDLAQSAFNGLRSLRKLHLNNNRLKLRLNKPPFQPLVFSQLMGLQILHLHQNRQPWTNESGYPDESLSYLAQLRVLSLDGIPNKDFGPGFRNLSKLHTLNLGNDIDYCCSLPIISSSTFINLEPTNLTYLYLRHCDIEIIDPEGFRPLRKIHTLKIEWASLTFSKLKIGLIGLSSSQIKVLDLNHIEKEMEFVLPERTFEALVNSSLTDLIFIRNWVTKIEDHLLEHVPRSIEKLDMSQNGIVLGKQNWLLYTPLLPNLRVANLSYQASGLNLRQILKMVFLNNHTNTENAENGQSIPVVASPQNLEYIYLKNCNLNLRHLGPVNFTKNKLKYVDFSGNFMEFKGPLYNLHRLAYIDFSHASSDVLHRDFFSDMPSLETLLLNNNRLNCLSADLKGETFSSLRKLKYLDLSQNGIEHMPESMFLQQRNLQTLLLHSNYINKWITKLGHMINITYLDLSQNRLTTFEAAARNDLDKVMRNPNFRINLLNNQLQCSCDGLDFLKWLLRRREFFLHFEKYVCTLADQRNTSFAHLSQTIVQLQKDCMSGTVLIAAAVSLAGLLGVIFLAGCVYRHRWQVRYFKNRLALRLQLYQPLLEENDHFDMNYDCFLSYHESQHEFIIDTVYPILEQQHGFKLCIHSRDFIPGNPVAANIYRAVHNSNLTVPFVTESYFDSQWCVYELKMAYLESVHTGHQLLLPVLMEPIDFTKLSADIQRIFKYITYLEYSHTDENDFFLKMLERLREGRTYM